MDLALSTTGHHHRVRRRVRGFREPLFQQVTAINTGRFRGNREPLSPGLMGGVNVSMGAVDKTVENALADSARHTVAWLPGISPEA